MTVLFALHRIGPYHEVRFRAAVEAGLDLVTLEICPKSREYAWDFSPTVPTRRYGFCDQSPGGDSEAEPLLPNLDYQISNLLNLVRPNVVVCTGWAHRSYLRLLWHAHRRGIPSILISDSRWDDSPRHFVAELLKRCIVANFSAALVAGLESRKYLLRLGFPETAIFQPWDVVDNTYFEQASRISRKVSPGPFPIDRRPHFLSVGRAIREKNHDGLLKAYNVYQQQGGEWGLRIIGCGVDGPHARRLAKLISRLPYPERVALGPFLAQEQVAVAYGLASALILASRKDTWGLVVNEAIASRLPVIVSTSCGCASDLISHGVTGWSFDPCDTGALARLMVEAQNQPSHERLAMIEAALRRLEHYSLTSFADGIISAVNHAITTDRQNPLAIQVPRLLSFLR